MATRVIENDTSVVITYPHDVIPLHICVALVEPDFDMEVMRDCWDVKDPHSEIKTYKGWNNRWLRTAGEFTYQTKDGRVEYLWFGTMLLPNEFPSLRRNLDP